MPAAYVDILCQSLHIHLGEADADVREREEGVNLSVPGKTTVRIFAKHRAGEMQGLDADVSQATLTFARCPFVSPDF